MQLEGGQLFLWRIKNDACVRTVRGRQRRRAGGAVAHQPRPDPAPLHRNTVGTSLGSDSAPVSHHPMPQAPADPGDPADEARRWAEHPALVPSVLDPGTLALRDVPLEASYGR